MFRGTRVGTYAIVLDGLESRFIVISVGKVREEEDVPGSKDRSQQERLQGIWESVWNSSKGAAGLTGGGDGLVRRGRDRKSVV